MRKEQVATIIERMDETKIGFYSDFTDYIVETFSTDENVNSYNLHELIEHYNYCINDEESTTDFNLYTMFSESELNLIRFASFREIEENLSFQVSQNIISFQDLIDELHNAYNLLQKEGDDTIIGIDAIFLELLDENDKRNDLL